MKKDLSGNKTGRRWVYALSAVLLTVIFAAGYITVYKNSYNMMHDKPMIVLKFYRTDTGLSVIFLNERYDIDIT